MELATDQAETRVWSDTPSRWLDYFVKDSDNNLNQVILSDHHFKVTFAQFAEAIHLGEDLLSQICSCTNKDHKVAKALELVQEFGPIEGGLWLHS